MEKRLNVVFSIYSLFLILASFAKAQNGDFDITHYGGQSHTDITAALSNAWKDACDSGIASRVVIPKGAYKLTKAILLGPCRGHIDFQVDGLVQAPPEVGLATGDRWIVFEHVDHLRIYGTGTFDGQGQQSWGRQCDRTTYCGTLPINLRFHFVTNSIVTGITSLNSKQFHVNVLGCNNLTFQHFTISAPESSLNTDGIHIARSTGINVLDTNIATGDDCVSIGDGAKQVTVKNVRCGPGHGISVGSLGKYQHEEPVSGIHVQGCTFTNTQTGGRIKTWPDSYQGTCTDIRFEDLTMNNVTNPIVIDQKYCPWNKCNLQVPSKVKINQVIIKSIRGTSSSANAIKIVCSPGMPCDGIEIGNVNLRYNGREPIMSQCENVKPRVYGVQNPVPCSVPTPSGSKHSRNRGSSSKGRRFL